MYLKGKKLEDITEADIAKYRENKVVRPSPNYPIEGVGLWDILDNGADKFEEIQGYSSAMKETESSNEM
ncbi:MAG: hypothetical protein FWE45_02580 [Firmicutes bacterium]|nr:hypothetical protein [Bacillota bacterium]